jgi:hypothetical protein
MCKELSPQNTYHNTTLSLGTLCCRGLFESPRNEGQNRLGCLNEIKKCVETVH